ncbi:MAG: glucosyl-3-phosphoglycerate synthase [archaeon]
MNVEEWFVKNRYKYTSFSNIKRLVKLKKQQNLTISLFIPTYNEADNIGNVISVLKSGLIDKYGLIDEIAVIDSGSSDDTLKIAKNCGAKAYLASECLPKEGVRGKGENIWKSQYLLKGDIICWVDADIKNIHPRFVYGLVGPLLTKPKLNFVKPFYRRPIANGVNLSPLGGGRVTELLVRPLFNQYFPRLSGFIQPLSGEAAIRREVLEKIPVFSGYGVETGMLIDIVKKFGLRTIAQVNLIKRVHRNQNLQQLSNMAFAILQVFAKRANSLGKLILVREIRKKYRVIEQYRGDYILKSRQIHDVQLPPMITVDKYRKKFKKDPKWVYL